MITETGFSRGFVQKRWGLTSLEDKPRSDRPRSALTEPVMNFLEKTRGKRKGNSTRKLARKLTKRLNDVSKSSISRGFLKMGLPYLRRPKVSRLSEKNKTNRYICAKRYKDEPPEYWDDYLFTDEKIWQLDGYDNPQNDGVRETSSKNVEPKEKSKFPDQRMV